MSCSHSLILVLDETLFSRSEGIDRLQLPYRRISCPSVGKRSSNRTTRHMHTCCRLGNMKRGLWTINCFTSQTSHSIRVALWVTCIEASSLEVRTGIGCSSRMNGSRVKNRADRPGSVCMMWRMMVCHEVLANSGCGLGQPTHLTSLYDESEGSREERERRDNKRKKTHIQSLDKKDQTFFIPKIAQIEQL